MTLALHALGDDVPLIDLADELSRMLCTWGRVAVLHPGDAHAPGALLEDGAPERMTSRDAVAKFTPLVERCELDHDQVILVCGASARTAPWDEFCLARADKVIVVVSATVAGPHPPVSHAGQWASLRGCDLLGYGIERGSECLVGWMAELAPVSTYAIRTDHHRRGDMARMARRLAGRAVGVVLSGGGARGLAHLGVIERLQSAGVVIDRVGGVSMGAFIGLAVELQYRRGRTRARRLQDRGAGVGCGAAGVSPDRRGSRRGPSSRLRSARGPPVVAAARARADLRPRRPAYGHKGVSPSRLVCIRMCRWVARSRG